MEVETHASNRWALSQGLKYHVGGGGKKVVLAFSTQEARRGIGKLTMRTLSPQTSQNQYNEN